MMCPPARKAKSPTPESQSKTLKGPTVVTTTETPLSGEVLAGFGFSFWEGYGVGFKLEVIPRAECASLKETV
eukprot:3831253-Amphidinium_carterae.1